jgi:hypothetical protein
VQEFAAARASGTQAGYIELLHYRLCGILPFQDMRSMYGCGVPFVPGTRCGGARKTSTVWRQVATARGPQTWRLDRRQAPVAAQTAIEYEYRFTEYRYAEYEYDEIRCEARTRR